MDIDRDVGLTPKAHGRHKSWFVPKSAHELRRRSAIQARSKAASVTRKRAALAPNTRLTDRTTEWRDRAVRRGRGILPKRGPSPGARRAPVRTKRRDRRAACTL